MSNRINLERAKIMMRLWQITWENILTDTQTNPFKLIEVLMLFLAVLLLIVWGIHEEWPYLVLALSYGIGASISVLIRSNYLSYPQKKLNQLTAISILILSILALTDVMFYLE